MTSLTRWAKFNLVGAIGMAIQLMALAGFNRIFRPHYLYATAAALEFTLLHNFLWHLHYTWRDRRHKPALRILLVRFHLSNGAVSMLGNLALMRVLVQQFHLPLLIANGVAILSCSIANFYLGDAWAFAEPPNPGDCL
ncbi:MAG TPA: GtrA family protein [Acidobacteriaceae bacterium]|nr:GtrA family protein [Acidobacteriaceae bacterium]